MELQSGESPNETKNPIRPVDSPQRYPVILHESPQERCMTLFLADEQFNYPKQARYLFLPRETLCRSPKRSPLRLFAELKRRDGACNERPFVVPQSIRKTMRNTTRMPSVMFEMIQPDLEISSTHAALLTTQPRE
jgi:hypothetical protein